VSGVGGTNRETSRNKYAKAQNHDLRDGKEGEVQLIGSAGLESGDNEFSCCSDFNRRSCSGHGS